MKESQEEVEKTHEEVFRDREYQVGRTLTHCRCTILTDTLLLGRRCNCTHDEIAQAFVARTLDE